MEKDPKKSFYYFLITSFMWIDLLPRFLQYCFLWITNLHYIIVLFYVQFEFITSSGHDTFTFFLHKFSKIIAFKNIFAPGTSSQFINVFLILTWSYSVLFVILVLVLVIKYYIKEELSTLERYILFFLGQFHLTIGFWLVNTFLISSISVYFETETIIGNYSNQSIVVKAFHYFLIVFHYCLGLLFAILSYDPFRSSNISATHTPIYQIMTFITKGLLLPFICASNTDNTELWVFSILSPIFTLLQQIYLLARFPYYYHQAMEIALSLNSAVLVIEIVNIVCLGIKENIQVSPIVGYLQLFLIILAIKFAQNFLRETIKKFLIIPENSLTTQNEVIKCLFARTYIIQNGKISLVNKIRERREVEFLGMCIYYNNEMNSQGKGLDLDSPKDFALYGRTYDEAIKIIIYELLNNSIQRLKRSDELKLALAYHLLEQNTKLPIAITCSVQVFRNGGFNKFLALKLIDEIERRVQASYKIPGTKTLDMKTFADLERDSTEFTKMIHISCTKYVRFWELYCEPVVELDRLFILSQEIEKEDDLIQKFWEKSIRPHPMIIRSLIHVYTFYLSVLRNSPTTALKLKRKYQISDYLENRKEFEGIYNENLNNPENVVFRASLEKEALGRIMYVSSNIKENLGWEQKDLVGKNVNTLMLPSMKETHDQILLRYLRQGPVLQALDTSHRLFVQTKQGNIVLIHLYFTMYPYLENRLSYVAVIRMRKHNERIILNEQGIAEGVTYNIMNKLNISPSENVPITRFCRNYEDIGIFGMKTQSKQVQSKLKKALKLSKSSSSFIGNQGNEDQRPTREWLFTHTKKLSLKMSPVIKRSNHYGSEIHHYSAVLTYLPFYDTFFYILDLEKQEGTGQDESFQIKEKKTLPPEPEPEIKKETHFSEITEEDEDPSIPAERGHYKELIHSSSEMKFSPKNFSSFRSPRINSPKLRSERDQLIQSFSKGENTFKSSGKTITIGNQSQRVKELIDNHDVSSTKSSSTRSTNLKIEHALYHVPKEKRENILKLSFLLFSVFSGLLLILFQGENSNTIQQIAQNTLIASNCSRQLGSLVQLNEWTMRYDLMDKNIYDEYRFFWLGTSYLSISTANRIKVSLDEIISLNMALRNEIFKVADDFQYKFYEEIPVYHRDDNNNLISEHKVGPFDLVDQVIAAGLRLYNRTAVGRVPGDNQDIIFIHDNTLNDLLIFGENVVNIVIEDSEKRLNNNMKLLLTYALITAGIAFVLIALFIHVIIKFVRQKNKMLFVLLRLNEQDIKPQIFRVSHVYKLFENENMDGRRVNIYNIMEPTTAQKPMGKDSQMYRRKQTVSKSEYRYLIIVIAYSLLLTALLFLGYVVAFPLVSKEKDEAKRKLDLILNCDTNQYESLLLYYETLLYVSQYGEGTLRDQSLDEEWNRTYNMFRKHFSQFVTLAREVADESQDSIIHEILLGNLCEIFSSRFPLGNDFCPSAMKGMITNGLIQETNYIMTSCQETKTTFDLSPKGIDDITAVLNVFWFLEIEPMASDFWFPAFQRISDLVRKEFFEESKGFKKASGRFTFSWGIIFIIFGTLGWWKIFAVFNDYRLAWLRMIRLVPLYIVTNNKMLKTYLTLNRMKAY